MHSLDRLKYAICEKYRVFDKLKKLQAEGKIRHLGFSFHDTPELLEKIVTDHRWDFAQIQLNYLDWEMQDAKGQYEILVSHGLPCVVMEPSRGGRADIPAGIIGKVSEGGSSRGVHRFMGDPVCRLKTGRTLCLKRDGVGRYY